MAWQITAGELEHKVWYISGKAVIADFDVTWCFEKIKVNFEEVQSDFVTIYDNNDVWLEQIKKPSTWQQTVGESFNTKISE